MPPMNSTAQNRFMLNSSSKQHNLASKAYADFLIFKPIKETQMLHNAPPSLSYSKTYHNEQCELLYKLLKCDSKLVRSILEANGFNHTESHDWNVLWMNNSGKPYLFEGLNEFQRINHFPSSYELTRKDRLCVNVVRMQEKYGKYYYDIVPDTYCLPEEYADFYAHYHRLKAQDPKKNLWITKPNALSRGRGIFVTDDI